MACRQRAPHAAEGHKIASFRWLARNREGPGAESDGNERRTLETSLEETTMEGGEETKDGKGEDTADV